MGSLVMLNNSKVIIINFEFTEAIESDGERPVIGIRIKYEQEVLVLKGKTYKIRDNLQK